MAAGTPAPVEVRPDAGLVLIHECPPDAEDGAAECAVCPHVTPAGASVLALYALAVAGVDHDPVKVAEQVAEALADRDTFRLSVESFYGGAAPDPHVDTVVLPRVPEYAGAGVGGTGVLPPPLPPPPIAPAVWGDTAPIPLPPLAELLDGSALRFPPAPPPSRRHSWPRRVANRGRRRLGPAMLRALWALAAAVVLLCAVVIARPGIVTTVPPLPFPVWPGSGGGTGQVGAEPDPGGDGLPVPAERGGAAADRPGGGTVGSPAPAVSSSPGRPAPSGPAAAPEPSQPGPTDPAPSQPAPSEPGPILPTDVLPTDVLPTDVLPTDVLPTDVLPTDVLPTDVLPTVPGGGSGESEAPGGGE